MFELCKENLRFSVIYYKFVRLFGEELFGNIVKTMGVDVPPKRAFYNQILVI